MSDKPKNQPAFPCKYVFGDEAGMSLRDWFAGQALAGLMYRADGPAQRGEIAAMVYAIADAILAERERQP